MTSRRRRATLSGWLYGWLYGDDLKDRRERELWGKQMQIHSMATYVVEEAVDVALRSVIHKIASAEFTDSDSDGTVGSDIEYEMAADADWDLVAI